MTPTPLRLRLLPLLALALMSPFAGAQEAPEALTATPAFSVAIAEPPTAKAGECWSLVVVPATFERHVESVLKTPAGERQIPKPARYEWIEQTVTVPAGKRRIVTKAAEYEVSEEQVLISPAGSRAITTPAKYRTIEERVPSKTGAVLKPHPVTGELCVVEGPIEYQIIKRKQLIEPAGTQMVETQARYKTVKHRKLITPAETKLVDRPERTITKRVKQLAEPAGFTTEPTPAVYEDAVSVVQTSPARSEWRSMLCETNMKPGLVRRIQQALKESGHDPGRTDGRWNAQSSRALRQFQAANGLPETGLSMESLERLQVTIGG